MSPGISNRTIRSYTQSISAPPGKVFPLLCPVREAEWLEGWRCDLIHSKSGLAEEGCVFRTQPEGDPETLWVITRHSAIEGAVEFVRVTAGLVATTLAIRVAPAGSGASSVTITYAFTPLCEAGVRFVEERHSEEAFRKSMAWWEASMNHFLATGERLSG